MIRAFALALLLHAAPARAAVKDFAEMSPLAGGYAGPLVCGTLNTGFDLSVSKVWEEPFVSVRVYAGANKNPYRAAYVPGRTVFEGRLTPAPGKSPPGTRRYILKGRSFALMKFLLLGVREPVTLPAMTLTMGPGDAIALEAAKDGVTLSAKGAGEKDRRPHAASTVKGPWRDYVSLKFDLQYREPLFSLDCKGVLKKSTHKTMLDGTIYDPAHRGEYGECAKQGDPGCHKRQN